MSQTLKELRQIASHVAGLQKQARSMGIFPGACDLLECPNYGRLEDVTIGGQLITRCPPPKGQDTGLRFGEFSQNLFRYPACGSMVRED